MRSRQTTNIYREGSEAPPAVRPGPVSPQPLMLREGFRSLFPPPVPESTFEFQEPALDQEQIEDLLQRDLVPEPTRSPFGPRASGRPPIDPTKIAPSQAGRSTAPPPSTAQTPHLASAVTPGPALPPAQKDAPLAQPILLRQRPGGDGKPPTPQAVTTPSPEPPAAPRESMRSKPRLERTITSDSRANESAVPQSGTSGRLFIKAAPIEAIDGIKAGKSGSSFAASWVAAANRPKETPRKTLSGLSFSERMDELDPLEEGLPLRPHPEHRTGVIHPEALLRYISRCCECGFKILQRLYLCLQCAHEERVVVMQSEVRFARDGFYFRNHSDAIEFSPLARQLFAEGQVQDVVVLRKPPMYPQHREMLALNKPA